MLPCHSSLSCHGDGGGGQHCVMASVSRPRVIIDTLAVMYLWSAAVQPLGTSRSIVMAEWAGLPGRALWLASRAEGLHLLI